MTAVSAQRFSAQISCERRCVLRDPECALQRGARALLHFRRVRDAHDKTSDHELLWFSVQFARGMKAVSRNREHTVFDAVIGKSIDKEFLNRNWFDQRLVLHGTGTPRSHSARRQQIARRVHENTTCGGATLKRHLADMIALSRGENATPVPRRASISQITFLSRFSSSIDIVASGFVAFVGVASCGANQAGGNSRGRVRTSEQLFHENLTGRNRSGFPNSVASARRSGPTSLRSTWRSAPVSPNAALSISSTASASRTLARCSRFSARSSANFLSGWSSPVAHQAHNLKVTGSNPVPATNHQFADACQPAPGSRAWGNCGHTTFAFGHRAPLRANASAFSSGDGLGILEPGSNTQGERPAALIALSGRARDRAICPAVARSDYRRVA